MQLLRLQSFQAGPPDSQDPVVLLAGAGVVLKELEGVMKAKPITAAKAEEFRSTNNIVVQNCDPVPPPALEFNDVDFGPEVPSLKTKWGPNVG